MESGIAGGGLGFVHFSNFVDMTYRGIVISFASGHLWLV